MAFKRALDVESIPSLHYSSTPFWMQIHNVPERHLTQEKGESVGKTLGTVVQVADPEDNWAGGEFFRVRINLELIGW